MSKVSYQVRAYNVKHDCDVSELLEDYREMLQKAVGEIWARTRFVKKSIRGKGVGSYQYSLKMEPSNTTT